MGTSAGKACKTVGARELKTRLGGYLREVQRGKTLTITERGVPVARLSPIEPLEGGLEGVLDELALQGTIAKRETSGLEPYVALDVEETSLDETIVEGREDRF